MALTRLCRKGVIRQLARGLYDFPIDHPSLGRIAPSADAVAKALAARDAVRLQPAGAYAANMLGLSDQVPTKVVFLTRPLRKSSASSAISNGNSTKRQLPREDREPSPVSPPF
jgi:hypothetical protein